jgi:SAM-dependent methyltransferase
LASDEPFGSAYAAAYDGLYHDKDYEAECDLIERVLRVYSPMPVRRILDLGCGTGNHAIPLARRGYDVVGIDRSEWMLAEGRQKSAAEHLSVTFAQGDVRTFDVNEQFDAVLMMFAVLGYQESDEDVLASFRSARRHLRPEGLFLCDVWYGPAVVENPPQARTKVVQTPRGEVRRMTSVVVDAQRHAATIHFELTGPGIDPSRGREDHRVRYFFPDELKQFASRSGFDLVRIGAFPEFEREPDAETWNVMLVARGISRWTDV